MFIRKAILITLMTTLFLLSMSTLVLNHTRLNTTLISLIEEKVEKSSENKLSLGELKINLLILGVETKNLKYSYKTKELSIYAQLPYFSSRLSLLGILFGETRLSDVEINEAKILIESRSNKALKENKPLQLNFDLKRNFINNLELNNLSLEYKELESKNQNDFILNGFNLNLKAKRHKALNGTFSFNNFSAKKNVSFPIKEFSFESKLQLTQNLFLLNDIKLKNKNISLEGSIETALLRNPKTNLIENLKTQSHISGSLGLKILSPFLKKKKDKASGKLHIKDEAQINYSLKEKKIVSFSSKGNLLSEQARFKNFNLLKSEISYKSTIDEIIFTEIKLIKGTKELAKARGKVNFNGKVPLEFNINLKTTVQRVFELFSIDNDTIDLELRSPNLHLSGNAIPLQLSIKGTTQVDNFSLLELKEKTKSPLFSSCKMMTDIYIDKKHMDFGKKTKGKCYLNKKTKAKEPEENISSGDLHIKGDIFFSKKKGKGGSNLYFFSKDIPYAIASTFVPTNLEGHGSSSVNIKSKDKRTTTLIKFKGKKVHLEKIPLLDSHGSLLFADGKLKLDHVTSYSGIGDLISNGTINFESGIFEVEAKSLGLKQEATSIALKHFFPSLVLSFSSDRFKIKARGKLSEILAARGKLEGTFKNVLWENKKIFDTLELDLHRNKKNIILESCVGLLGNYALSCEGHLDQKDKGTFSSKTLKEFNIFSEDSFRFNYSLEQQSRIKNSQRLPFVEDFFEEQNLSVNHLSRGAIYGTIEEPNLTITGSLNHIIYKKSLKFSNINYTLNADKEKFELYFQQSGDSLFGNIVSHWGKKKSPFKASIKLDQFDIRFLLPNLFHLDPRNFSYLTSDIDFSGFYGANLKVEKALLSLHNFHSYFFYEFSGENKFLELNLEKSYRFKLNSNSIKKNNKENLLTLKNEFLEFNVKNFETFLQKDGKLDITGALDLSVLSETHPSILYSKGRARLKGHFGLKHGKLDYSLNLKNRIVDKNDSDLKSASILVPGLEPLFENIIFDIDYTNGILNFNHFFSEKGEGTISLTGNFALDKETTLDEPLLSMELNNSTFNIKTPYLKEIETNLSGKIFLKEKNEPYQVFGDIVINKLNSNMNYNFTQEAIRSLQKRQLTQSLTEVTKEPFFLFDINILSDKTISINNNTINLTASGDIKILGSSKNMALAGILRTENGTFRYKKDFDIERCFVYFDEGDTLDPSIDIKASSIIDNYKVNLNILGKASNPLVDFDINPQVSREDNQRISPVQIMYLISQGSLPKSKTTILSNGIFSYDQNVMASLNYATDILPLDILDSFFGTDFIYLRPEFSDIWGDGSFFTLSTLVNLRKDLNIKVQTSPNLSRASFSVEYQFNNHIKSLLDFKIGDKRDDAKRRYQSFNLKFNFPF